MLAMTDPKTSSPYSVSTARYIQWLFEPSDKLAVLVRNRERGETTQRITSASKAADDPFQNWLRLKNEKLSSDIYIGMNPLKPEARARTKEDIYSIRHLYMDLDHDAPRSRAAVEQSNLVPSPNVVIKTSPEKFQLVWRVEGFTQEQAEAMLRVMARKFGGDPAATDSTRVLRLPGFINRKYEFERTVTAKVHSDRRYTAHDFRLRTDPSELDHRPTRLDTPREGGSSRQPLSQSEHDWAYAKRSLAKVFRKTKSCGKLQPSAHMINPAPNITRG
jgi:RepB DNA-primase N-terminal domain